MAIESVCSQQRRRRIINSVNGLPPVVPDFEAGELDKDIFEARAVRVDTDHFRLLLLRKCHDTRDHGRGIFRDEPELVAELPHLGDGRDPAEAVFRPGRGFVRISASCCFSLA